MVVQGDVAQQGLLQVFAGMEAMGSQQADFREPEAAGLHPSAGRCHSKVAGVRPGLADAHDREAIARGTETTPDEPTHTIACGGG